MTFVSPRAKEAFLGGPRLHPSSLGGLFSLSFLSAGSLMPLCGLYEVKATPASLYLLAC